MNVFGKIFAFSAFSTILMATQSGRVLGEGIFLILSIVFFVMWFFTAEEKER